MLSHHQIVIHLTRSKLTVGKVVLGKEPLVKDRFEAKWTVKTLPEIFQEIREEFQTNKARVVLADSLSHVLEIKVPGDVDNLREYIARKLKRKIHEMPGDEEWDFRKAVFPLSKEEKVLVFAPEKKILATLTDAAGKAQLTIEAIEPKKIATKRHPDPMIGIALKRDLEGPDEKVLNISIEEENEAQRFTLSINKKFLLLVSILAVFAAGGFLALWVSGNFRTKTETPTPLPEEVAPTLLEEASPAASKKEVEIKPEDYHLQVLNGSGTPGEAGRVRDLLSEQGFAEAEIGNADSFSYTETKVQLKETTPKGIIEILSQALGRALVEGEPLDPTSPFDIVIILGKQTPASQTQN